MVKCLTCKKKLKLVVAIKGKCRCGNTYCGEHIQTHKCSFDYKSLQQKKLVQENPVIIPEKLNHI